MDGRSLTSSRRPDRASVSPSSSTHANSGRSPVGSSPASSIMPSSRAASWKVIGLSICALAAMCSGSFNLHNAAYLVQPNVSADDINTNAAVIRDLMGYRALSVPQSLRGSRDAPSSISSSSLITPNQEVESEQEDENEAGEYEAGILSEERNGSSNVSELWPKGREGGGGPRYLAFIPLLGRKYGDEKRGTMEAERLSLRAWDKIAQDLAQSGEGGGGNGTLRIVGMVEDESHCDPLLQGLTAVSCIALDPSCRHPVHDILTLDCIFKRALELGRPQPPVYPEAATLIFANGDIIFTSNLIEAIAYTQQSFGPSPGYAMVGRRIDVNVSLPQTLDDPAFDEHSFDRESLQYRSHQALGVDYFAFTAETFPLDFPPYLVGRWRWDNALLFQFFMRGVPTVDASEVVHALHLGMHSSDSSQHIARSGGVYNDQLAQQTTGKAHSLGRIDRTAYILRRIGKGKEGEGNLILKRRAQPLAQAQIAALRVAQPAWFRPFSGILDGDYDTEQQQQHQPTVSLVSVEAGQTNNAREWVCWADRYGLTNRLLLTADLMDAQALQDAGEVVIHMNPRKIDELRSRTQKGQHESQAVPQVLHTARAMLAQSLLRLNMTVILTDPSMIWTQNLAQMAAMEAQCDIIRLNLPSSPEAGRNSTTAATTLSSSDPFLALRPSNTVSNFWLSVASCLLVQKNATSNSSKKNPHNCLGAILARYQSSALNESFNLNVCGIGSAHSSVLTAGALLARLDAAAWSSSSIKEEAGAAFLPFSTPWGVIEGADDMWVSKMRKLGLQAFDRRTETCMDATWLEAGRYQQSVEIIRGLKIHLVRRLDGPSSYRAYSRSLRSLTSALDWQEEEKEGKDLDTIDLEVSAVRKGRQEGGWMKEIPWPHGALTVKEVTAGDGGKQSIVASERAKGRMMLMMDEGVELLISSKTFLQIVQHFRNSSWIKGHEGDLLGLVLHEGDPSRVLRLSTSSSTSASLLIYKYQPSAPAAMLFLPQAWDGFQGWLIDHLSQEKDDYIPCQTRIRNGGSSFKKKKGMYTWQDYLARYVAEEGLYAISLQGFLGEGKHLARRLPAASSLSTEEEEAKSADGSTSILLDSLSTKEEEVDSADGTTDVLLNSLVAERLLQELRDSSLEKLPLYDAAMNRASCPVALRVRHRLLEGFSGAGDGKGRPRVATECFVSGEKIP